MIGRSLRNPKPGTEFRVYRNRLALFHQTQHHAEYWEKYWRAPGVRTLEKEGRRGDLGELAGICANYLPRDSPILEAGCGPAHLVAALSRRGYKVVGVDNQVPAIRAAKRLFPELHLEVGDIVSLGFPAGVFGAYLSLGVVEHFVESPGPALREARRVLHPRGIALISVPYLNPARRRLLHRLRAKPQQPSGLFFHQYYYGPEDFSRLLGEAGFRVLDWYVYAIEAFLAREHPAFRWFWTSRLRRERVKSILRGRLRTAPMPLRWRYGHMLMAVCQPTEPLAPGPPFSQGVGCETR
jgi:SAM-dependent methyltransferase